MYHYGRPGEEYHHTLLELAEEVAALATPPSPTAAPSGVSDAMVERAWMAFTGRDKLGPAYANDASCMMDCERRDIRAALEAALEAAQPQPGRVEGMVLVPVEPTPEMLMAAGTMNNYDIDAGGRADDDHIAWWRDMLKAATASSQEPDHG